MPGCSYLLHTIKPCCGHLFAWIFWGFLCSRDFTCSHDCSCTSEFHDIAVDRREDPTYMTIRLHHHKTDQSGKGMTIAISRTGDDLCLVAAVLAFMVIHPDIPGPLFVIVDGSPLSREFLVRSVKTASAATGVDTAGHNGHSFRIEVATAATQTGFPDSLIQS